ncbi:MAG: TonB-dependent receptor [Erythrobacter sp.]
MRTALVKALVTTAMPISLVALAGTAAAQENVGGDDSAVVDDDQGGNRIIVTARRVEEDLQEVPASITAFSAQDLEDRSISELEDIALQTPGLVFEDFSNGGFATPTIRGTTQFSVTQLERNVAIFLDGIAIPRNYAFDIGATDFSRIEVVKGPQSALYGANAFAGAINYVTTERSLTELSIGGKVDISENGGLDLFADLSVPIVEDVLAVRLAVGRSEFDGDFTNNHPSAGANLSPGTDEDIGGFEKDSIQVGASVSPFSALKIDFDYYRFDTLSETRAAFRISREAGDTNCSPATAFFAQVNQLFCGELPSTPIPGASGVEGFVVDPRTFGIDSTSELIRIGAELEITDQITLSYLYGDYSGNAFSAGGSDRDAIVGTTLFGQTNNAFTFLPSGNFDYETHELRAEFETDNGIYFLLGGFLQDGIDVELTAFGFVPLGGLDPIPALPAGIAATDSTIATEKTSIFGRVQVPLLDDRLNISAELRYTDEEITQVGSGLAPLNDSYFTTRGSIDYALTPDNLVYASVARGYKSGGINSSTGGITVADEFFFGPETNWTYEIGFKNTFLNGAATLNIAAFLIDWGDLQLPTTPTGADPFATSITQNIGSAQSRGVEVDALWEFVEGFTINAGLAYIDADYDEGTISTRSLTSGSFTVFPFENPVLCDDIVCNANGDIGGNDIQRTSKWQWNVGLAGEVPVVEAFDAFGRVDVAGQSRQFVSELNTATIEPRTLVNARLGVRGDQWSASVWATNLFDEVYVANAFFLPNSFVLDYVPTLGNRRRIGVSFSFDY